VEDCFLAIPGKGIRVGGEKEIPTQEKGKKSLVGGIKQDGKNKRRFYSKDVEARSQGFVGRGRARKNDESNGSRP